MEDADRDIIRESYLRSVTKPNFDFGVEYSRNAGPYSLHAHRIGCCRKNLFDHGHTLRCEGRRWARSTTNEANPLVAAAEILKMATSANAERYARTRVPGRLGIRRRDRGHRQADRPSAQNRRRLTGPAVTKIWR
jgi:hypothetical protein